MRCVPSPAARDSFAPLRQTHSELTRRPPSAEPAFPRGARTANSHGLHKSISQSRRSVLPTDRAGHPRPCPARCGRLRRHQGIQTVVANTDSTEGPHGRHRTQRPRGPHKLMSVSCPVCGPCELSCRSSVRRPVSCPGAKCLLAQLSGHRHPDRPVTRSACDAAEGDRTRRPKQLDLSRVPFRLRSAEPFRESAQTTLDHLAVAFVSESVDSSTASLKMFMHSAGHSSTHCARTRPPVLATLVCLGFRSAHRVSQLTNPCASVIVR